MAYIKVKNLDEYQHYKNRDLIWIKWYINKHDHIFDSLPDDIKWVFVGLIGLAVKNDNKIPYDTKWIARKISVKNDLKKEIEILVDSDMISMCKQVDSPIREDKIREEKIDSKQKHLDFVYLTQKQYNSLFARFGQTGTAKWIAKLNNYAHKIGESKFKSKYKSHYHVILEWYDRDVKSGKIDSITNKPTKEDMDRIDRERGAK